MDLEYIEYEEIPFEGISSPINCFLDKTIQPDNSIETKWHEQLEIKYVVSGRLELICNSSYITAEAGDIIIINPCERHVNHINDTSNTKYHMMLIDLSEKYTGFLFNQFFSKLVSGTVKFSNLVNDPLMTQVALEMFEAFRNPSVDLFHVYSIFLKLIFNLKESHLQKKSDNNVSANKKWHKEIVNTALNYIFEHYKEPIRLSDIADICCITETHLCRVFKAETGKSPVNFIIEFRINKALVFLTHSKLSVKETAELCGFSDSAYFSRCFKKHMKMSPSEYLKEYTDYNKEKEK